MPAYVREFYDPEHAVVVRFCGFRAQGREGKLANKRKGLEWKAIDWKPVISVGQYCVTYVMEGLEERKILGEVASVSAIAAPRVFSWMYLCE